MKLGCFIVVYLAVLFICIDFSPAIASDQKCRYTGGKRVSIPGKWEPPVGTDPQWLNRNATTSQFIILSGGSVSPANFLRTLDAVFTIDNFNIAERAMHFQSGSSIFNDYMYTTNRIEDYIATESHPNATERKLFPNIISFPWVVQPIVFAYNYSNLRTFVVDRTSECVYLTVEMLADIYLGNLTNWNDTRITSYNPTLVAAFALLNQTFPNQTIVPMGYAGLIETSTRYVTEAFYRESKRFREAFPEGPPATWEPYMDRLSPNMKLVRGSYSTFAFVINTPGAISYMPYQVLHTSGAGAQAPYILFRDQKANPLEPQQENVMLPYQDTYLNKHYDLLGTDFNNCSTCWPISTTTYIHINVRNNISFASCGTEHGSLLSKDRLMLEYFRWMFTNEIASQQGSHVGIFNLPNHINKKIVKRLDGLVCYNASLPILEVDIINDHNTGYFLALLIIDIVAWVIMGTVGFVVFIVLEIIQDRKRVMSPVVFYTFLLLIGSSVLYLSTVFFYLTPDDDSICQLRLWTLGLGTAITLGSLFGRINTLFTIARADLGGRMPGKSVKSMRLNSLRDFIVSICLSLLVQLGILIPWTIKDPLSAKLVFVDEVQRQQRWVCKSDDIWLWFGLEVGFCMVLMAYGLYVVLRCLDRGEKFSNSRWLMVIIYNIILGAASFVPILATITIDDANLFIIQSTAVIFEVTQILFFVYLPKFEDQLYTIIRRFRPTNSSKNSTSSTNTNSASISKNSASSKRTHEDF